MLTPLDLGVTIVPKSFWTQILIASLGYKHDNVESHVIGYCLESENHDATWYHYRVVYSNIPTETFSCERDVDKHTK
jgi:hypothetical protein